jgi:type II secretion system (T2SS) protein G
VSITGDAPVNWKGPYLRQIVPLDPWGRVYVYLAPGMANPNSYDMTKNLYSSERTASLAAKEKTPISPRGMARCVNSARYEVRGESGGDDHSDRACLEAGVARNARNSATALPCSCESSVTSCFAAS